ncbi:hypothetical protein FA95DRAFT_1405164 [Auriscalpium vulgare]|uniref:Uncharacterized protein n=1 Tax=Auriscalpium vulgare TaxID=40419 RepID=A0ACB8RQE9_9AGAM|nr:hypothetical protein FA95DRAFT_1405164 [Auriscalpium vulgare]
MFTLSLRPSLRHSSPASPISSRSMTSLYLRSPRLPTPTCRPPMVRPSPVSQPKPAIQANRRLRRHAGTTRRPAYANARSQRKDEVLLLPLSQQTVHRNPHPAHPYPILSYPPAQAARYATLRLPLPSPRPRPLPRNFYESTRLSQLLERLGLSSGRRSEFTTYSAFSRKTQQNFGASDKEARGWRRRGQRGAFESFVHNITVRMQVHIFSAADDCLAEYDTQVIPSIKTDLIPIYLPRLLYCRHRLMLVVI